MGRSRRTLPEELLLLALDPATGTTAQPQSLDLGLAGAQLVELALAGRIAPDGDRIVSPWWYHGRPEIRLWTARWSCCEGVALPCVQ